LHRQCTTPLLSRPRDDWHYLEGACRREVVIDGMLAAPRGTGMLNWDVIQGAGIALISATGGALLQEFLIRRTDRRERRMQFAHDTLLNLQAAVGDLAITAEQIVGEKRASGSWCSVEQGAAWGDLNKYRVQTIRYGVLVDDEELETLARALEHACTKMAVAQSESESASERERARELLRQTNIRIGECIRDL
jgi:hypothetical protein